MFQLLAKFSPGDPRSSCWPTTPGRGAPRLRQAVCARRLGWRGHRDRSLHIPPHPPGCEAVPPSAHGYRPTPQPPVKGWAGTPPVPYPSLIGGYSQRDRVKVRRNTTRRSRFLRKINLGNRWTPPTTAAIPLAERWRTARRMARRDRAPRAERYPAEGPASGGGFVAQQRKRASPLRPRVRWGCDPTMRAGTVLDKMPSAHGELRLASR